MRKKEPSNLTAPSSQRFTLPKANILRGRRNFKRLFTSSDLIKSHSVNLRYTCPEKHEGYLTGFIAPKRTGTAVQRNRTKRLLREAYRLQQHELSAFIDSLGTGVHMAFIARKSLTDIEKVTKEVATILQNLRTRLLSHSEPS